MSDWDKLRDLLRKLRAGQPAEPEYIVGDSAADGGVRYLGVNHIGAPGFDVGREVLRLERQYLIIWPAHLTAWVAGTIGQYLDDEGWEEAGEIRQAEREDAQG